MIRNLLLVLMVLACNLAFSQIKTATLTIEITGLKNSKGNVLIQLADEFEKTIGQQKAKVIDRYCVFQFKNLPFGKYAARVFHDENSNNELDTNLFGIPSEGYGFSNNAKAMFGPPPFKDRIFEIYGDKKITIKID